MDSVGIGAFVSVWASARKSGCELKFISLNDQIHDLFEITRFAQPVWRRRAGRLNRRKGFALQTPELIVEVEGSRTGHVFRSQAAFDSGVMSDNIYYVKYIQVH